MEELLVSIIVPTYNVEKYVEECIESILAQTYRNIEVLMIDDGSTDTTPCILKRYDHLVKLILNENNQGQGAVRNQGIEKATGQYILFVDADDWIEPNTVESLVHKISETGADLVRFNGKSFFEGGASMEKEGHYDFSRHLNEHLVYKNPESLLKNQKAYSASPCLYLMDAALLEVHQIRFPEGILHEDEYFTTRVFLHAEKMSYLNHTFYHRRYRTASTMTEQTPAHKKRSFESYLKVFGLMEKEYLSEKYSTQQKLFLKRQLLSIYNGLQMSTVEPKLKRQLKKLNTISIKDKIRINISKLRQHFVK